MIVSEERFFDNSDGLKKPSSEDTLTTLLEIKLKS